MKRSYRVAAGLSACLLLMQAVVPASIPVAKAEEKLRENKVSITEVYGSKKQDVEGFSFIEVHNGTEEAKTWKELALTYTTDHDKKLEFQEPDEQIPAGGYAVLALDNEATVETFNNHFGTELTGAAFTNVTEPYIFQDGEQQLAITDTATDQTSVSVFHFQDVEQAESIHFANDQKTPTILAAPSPGNEKIEQVQKEDTREDTTESPQPDAPEQDVKDDPSDEDEQAADAKTKDQEQQEQAEASDEKQQAAENEGEDEKQTTEETEANKETAQEGQRSLIHEAITSADGSSDLTIRASIENGNADSAVLTYITAPGMAEQKVDMTDKGDGTWEAVVPKEVLWSPSFQYSIEAVSGDSALRFPESGLQQTDIAIVEADSQTQPPVLITEIVPDSDNVNGSDAYEFIEVYNNSDQPMDLKDYKLSYQYPDGRQTDWDIDRAVTLEPKGKVVIWIKNGANQSLGLTDFNSHYQTDLTENQVIEIHNDGMANGSARTIAFQTDSGAQLVAASYNDAEGIDDTYPNQGITYKASGSAQMTKVGLQLKASPGSLIAGQVPSETVKMEKDETAPEITHEPVNTVTIPAPLRIEAQINEENFIQHVTLYIKKEGANDFEQFSMQQTGESYQAEIPTAELEAGTLEYYIETSDGFNSSKTDTFKVEVKQPDTDYTALPSLLVTELVPDSTNVNGADGYEFIEVYNNTTAPVDMQDYDLAYVYPDTRVTAWRPDESPIIQPGETAVFWVINGSNNDLTADDFNANYGTNLTLGENLFKVQTGGMANGSQRGVGVATKTGNTIAMATYNEVTGVKDTVANMGINYKYPLDGSTNMLKLNAGTIVGTPGSVTSDQVPGEPIQVEEDTVAPEVKDLTEIDTINQTEDLQLTVEASDDKGVKRVTVYYRTDENGEFKQVDLTKNEQTGYYHHSVYTPELIAKDYVEYYVTATDGFNQTKTKTKRVNIERDQKETSPRLNVEEGQLLSGTYKLKATSDTEQETTLLIDGKEVAQTDKALETKAYFAFDVNGINTYFQNAVVQDGEVLHIFDDWIDTYTTITVPVDPDTLKAGENTISIHSGNKASPFQLESPENRDDFDAKNVRLVLGDGTVLYDPAFADPNQVIDIGDNGNYRPVQDFTFTIDPEKFKAKAYDWDTTKTEDGTHTIEAKDGEASDKVSVTVDNTVPVIETAMEDGQSYKGPFTIEASAEDALSGLDSLTAELDGEEIQLPYETSSATLSAGDHKLVLRAVDKAGNEEVHTINFSTPDEHPVAPELIQPEDEAGNVGKNPELEVKVTDPTGDDMDVTFYQGHKYKVSQDSEIKAYKNAADYEPPSDYAPEGEEAFSSEDIDKVADVDDKYLINDSETQFPYHRFEVPVSKDVDDKNVVEVNWSGNSLPGRKVSMYAWNHQEEDWQLIDYKVAGDEDFDLQGSVNVDAFVKDYKINILIQDEIAIEDEDYDYSFVWMSDTQYYSESYPHIYNDQVNWIAENKDKYNIDYVIHTGDLVNFSDQPYQWEVADKAMQVLDDAGIPYGVLAGNHDVEQKSNDYTEYYKYFGADRFEDKPWYGGSYKNNRGHYDLISSNGNDYIMVYLGWGIEEEGIAWADAVLKAHPDRKAILNFHEYLLSSGNRHPIGEQLYQELVLDNENVFAVLCGHYHAADMLVDEIDDDGDGVTDRKVYQMLADYQAGPEGGQGYMRILLFDAETDQIKVKTYSPYMDDYNYYDEEEFPGVDEFSIGLELDAQKKRVATNYVEVNVFGTKEIGKAEDVKSGESASVTWDGLTSDHEYAWYAIAEDAHGGKTKSDLWTFTTEGGAPDPGDNGNEPPAENPPGGDDNGQEDPIIDDGENPPGDNEENPPANNGKNPPTNNGSNGQGGNTITPTAGNVSNVPGDSKKTTPFGGILPDTASHLYNYLLAGAVLLALGGALYWFNKRRTSNK
ncbi:LPXTG-motif cell wall anchor domain-containing protein [Terribacillus halophilus]|uniref:LPXTG-motif cell wall anchor domain-containing protein n=1 Tax=Terribacillus halophilus TaxID=361279 RepID=A0A1G6WGC5_9BACI|nr:lamin tail domain-containing protein [Terribacillus halophilus]SDD64912.1 LPXTG-motif cell wall anchor domain-containing protein [Terribacillus halophilus]